jgi:TPR repeat protein/serine/threonine protein kinase
MVGLHTDLSPGTMVGEAYRIERHLSAGGMGSVYVATHLKTLRQRALKLMHPALARDARFRERFAQEARVGASIHSEHVVEVMDAGVDQALGMPWLAMELLEGQDLAALIAHRGPMAREQVAAVFHQLGHALEAAHAVGVVHRDLKPENLFLARSRRADASFTLKILDFGIAKIVAESQNTAVTQSIGTPLWMAVEQTSHAGKVSTAADMWPLGLIAFFLLTGRLYWRTANAEQQVPMMLLREVAFDPMPPASARAAEYGVAPLVPPGFDAWFARCLERDPARRFGSVAELVTQLLPLLQQRAEPAKTLAQDPMLGTVEMPPDQREEVAPLTDRVPALAAPVVATYVPPTAPAATVMGAPHTPAAQTYVPVTGAAPPPPSVGRVSIPTPSAQRPGKRRLGLYVAIVAGVGAIAAVAAVLATRDWGGRAAVTKGQEKSCAAAVEQGGDVAPKALAVCKKACEATASPYCRYHAELLGRADGDAETIDDAYRRGCDDGDEHACQRLLLREEARGLDAAKLASREQKSCDGGRAAACTRAGDVVERTSSKNDAARAAELYRKGCDGGDSLGCAYQAIQLETGRGVARDATKAAAAFGKAAKGIESACAEAHGLECVALGWMRDRGKGVAIDPVRAVADQRRACDAGVPSGCNNLGALHALGRGVGRDPQEAERLFRRACDAKEPAGCNNLAVMRSGVVTTLRTDPRGVVVFKLSCADVLSVGCSGWGEELAVGEGVAAEPAAARKLLEQACDAGELHACVNLGGLVRSGVAGEPDAARAATLFERACGRGNAGACGEYASLLWHGRGGVARDRTRARELFRKACDGGEEDSCLNVYVDDVGEAGARAPAAIEALGRLCEKEHMATACEVLGDFHFSGKGLPQSDAKAAGYYQRACSGIGLDRPSSSACSSLAALHLSGKGVDKSPDKATQILEGACSKGKKGACAELAYYLAVVDGVKRDAKRGLELSKKLCAEGLAEGCGIAALILADGKAGARDDKAALPLARRGCNLGSATACSYLAEFLSSGRGGATKDAAEARRLWQQLCDDGTAWACKKTG